MLRKNERELLYNLGIHYFNWGVNDMISENDLTTTGIIKLCKSTILFWKDSGER